MAAASKALGAPEIAGAWIERKGFAKKGMNAIASAEIGGFVGDGRGDRTFRQRHTEADG
jgi:hypothetical protein